MKAACSYLSFLYTDNSALLVTKECFETTRISLGKELQKVAGYVTISYPCTWTKLNVLLLDRGIN